MKQKEMIDICKKHGLDVSHTLLYRQGKLNGFLVPKVVDGKERYEVDMKKFNQWLDKLEIDPNYVMVGDYARSNGMSYSALKYQLLKNKSKIRKLGIVRGGCYCVRREDAERAVSQYHKRVDKR